MAIVEFLTRIIGTYALFPNTIINKIQSINTSKKCGTIKSNFWPVEILTIWYSKAVKSLINLAPSHKSPIRLPGRSPLQLFVVAPRHEDKLLNWTYEMSATTSGFHTILECRPTSLKHDI